MRRTATALFAAGALVAGFVVPASAGAAFGPVTSFGGSGSAPGQFNHPQSAAATGAQIFIADSGNGRLQNFNTGNGNFTPITAPGAGFAPQDVSVGNVGFYAASPARVDHWGLLGIYGGSWVPPGVTYGVAVDPAGHVWVSDAQGGVIREYNAGGTTLLATIGQGQLSAPQGLTTDAAGGIYVADLGNGRIVKFGAAGDVQGIWNMPTYTIVANGQTITGRVEPHDVAVDGAGRVFAPDARTSSNFLLVFGADGSLQQLIGSPASDPGNPCPLSGPWGVTTSPSGALFVVSTQDNTIRVFSEAASACPTPDLGPGGGVTGSGGGGGGGGGGGPAGPDTKKPKVKLRKVPKKCARHNFAFRIRARDDGVITKLVLFINHRRVARQTPDKSEWNVKVNIPVRKIQRQLPRGTFVRVLIQVKVVDASGKKAKVRKSFRICG